MCVCVCVCERESVCVCVGGGGVSEGEIERISKPAHNSFVSEPVLNIPLLSQRETSFLSQNNFKLELECLVLA